jgi:4-amino-4-deoxy-L-arabinose transferase-like glycosyltransferase
VGVTALGAALRVGAADSGFVGDELFTYAIVSRDGFVDMLRGVEETENTPPLFYALGWLSHQAFEDPKVTRLPALLAGVATIPVTMLLARRVYGPRAALLAGLLTAVSPFAIYYSSEARAYAPATLAVVLSTLALLRAIDEDGRRWWALLAVSASAAVWFHYVAVFPLAAQAAWALLAHPERRREVVLAHGAAVLLYVPWLPFAGSNVPLAFISALLEFEPLQLLSYPARSVVGYPYLGLSEVPGSWQLAVMLAALAFASFLALRSRAGGLSGDDVLLVAMAAAAPVGLGLYTLLESNLFLPRNLLVSSPALIIVVAGLVARRPAAPALVAAALLAGLLVVPALRVSFGDLRRAAYDDVGAALDNQAGLGVPVIQVATTSIEGPLRADLTAWLERPHPHVFADEEEARGWDLGVRAGRVYVVRPLLPFAETERPSDPRFREVRRRVWDDALVGAVVSEWRYVGP